MEERANRKTEQKFFGCPNYPDCKMTMTPDAHDRFSGLPPGSYEEEQRRSHRGGEDRDANLNPRFWDPTDFDGVTGVEPGDEDIPEEM